MVGDTTIIILDVLVAGLLIILTLQRRVFGLLFGGFLVFSGIFGVFSIGEGLAALLQVLGQMVGGAGFIMLGLVHNKKLGKYQYLAILLVSVGVVLRIFGGIMEGEVPFIIL